MFRTLTASAVVLAALSAACSEPQAPTPPVTTEDWRSTEGIHYGAAPDDVTGRVVTLVQTDPATEPVFAMACINVDTGGPDESLSFWLMDLPEDEREYLANLKNDFGEPLWEIDVAYRIGDESPAVHEWHIAEGGMLTMGGGSARAFLDQFRGHSRLRLSISTSVYDFAIGGLLETPVQINIDECGWYPNPTRMPPHPGTLADTDSRANE